MTQFTPNSHLLQSITDLLALGFARAGSGCVGVGNERAEECLRRTRGGVGGVSHHQGCGSESGGA